MADLSMSDPQAWARQILDSNQYMVLGTVDDQGTPWASPVWFAHLDYRELFWVSRTDVQHSLNIAVRPEVGIVVFDSSVKPGSGQGVYMRATARELQGADMESGLEVYVTRSAAQTGWRPSVVDLSAPKVMRLYGAIVSDYS